MTCLDKKKPNKDNDLPNGQATVSDYRKYLTVTKSSRESTVTDPGQGIQDQILCPNKRNASFLAPSAARNSKLPPARPVLSCVHCARESKHEATLNPRSNTSLHSDWDDYSPKKDGTFSQDNGNMKSFIFDENMDKNKDSGCNEAEDLDTTLVPEEEPDDNFFSDFVTHVVLNAQHEMELERWTPASEQLQEEIETFRASPGKDKNPYNWMNEGEDSDTISVKSNSPPSGDFVIQHDWFAYYSAESPKAAAEPGKSTAPNCSVCGCFPCMCRCSAESSDVSKEQVLTVEIPEDTSCSLCNSFPCKDKCKTPLHAKAQYLLMEVPKTSAETGDCTASCCRVCGNFSCKEGCSEFSKVHDSSSDIFSRLSSYPPRYPFPKVQGLSAELTAEILKAASEDPRPNIRYVCDLCKCFPCNDECKAHLYVETSDLVLETPKAYAEKRECTQPCCNVCGCFPCNDGCIKKSNDFPKEQGLSDGLNAEMLKTLVETENGPNEESENQIQAQTAETSLSVKGADILDKEIGDKNLPAEESEAVEEPEQEAGKEKTMDDFVLDMVEDQSDEENFEIIDEEKEIARANCDESDMVDMEENASWSDSCDVPVLNADSFDSPENEGTCFPDNKVNQDSFVLDEYLNTNEDGGCYYRVQHEARVLGSTLVPNNNTIILTHVNDYVIHVIQLAKIQYMIELRKCWSPTSEQLQEGIEELRASPGKNKYLDSLTDKGDDSDVVSERSNSPSFGPDEFEDVMLAYAKDFGSFLSKGKGQDESSIAALPVEQYLSVDVTAETLKASAEPGKCIPQCCRGCGCFPCKDGCSGKSSTVPKVDDYSSDMFSSQCSPIPNFSGIISTPCIFCHCFPCKNEGEYKDLCGELSNVQGRSADLNAEIPKTTSEEPIASMRQPCGFCNCFPCEDECSSKSVDFPKEQGLSDDHDAEMLKALAETENSLNEESENQIHAQTAETLLSVKGAYADILDKEIEDKDLPAEESQAVAEPEQEAGKEKKMNDFVLDIEDQSDEDNFEVIDEEKEIARANCDESDMVDMEENASWSDSCDVPVLNADSFDSPENEGTCFPDNKVNQDSFVLDEYLNTNEDSGCYYRVQHEARVLGSTLVPNDNTIILTHVSDYVIHVIQLAKLQYMMELGKCWTPTSEQLQEEIELRASLAKGAYADILDQEIKDKDLPAEKSKAVEEPEQEAGKEKTMDDFILDMMEDQSDEEDLDFIGEKEIGRANCEESDYNMVDMEEKASWSDSDYDLYTAELERNNHWAGHVKQFEEPILEKIVLATESQASVGLDILSVSLPWSSCEDSLTTAEDECFMQDRPNGSVQSIRSNIETGMTPQRTEQANGHDRDNFSHSAFHKSTTSCNRNHLIETKDDSRDKEIIKGRKTMYRLHIEKTNDETSLDMTQVPNYIPEVMGATHVKCLSTTHPFSSRSLDSVWKNEENTLCDGSQQISDPSNHEHDQQSTAVTSMEDLPFESFIIDRSSQTDSGQLFTGIFGRSSIEIALSQDSIHCEDSVEHFRHEHNLDLSSYDISLPSIECSIADGKELSHEVSPKCNGRNWSVTESAFLEQDTLPDALPETQDSLTINLSQGDPECFQPTSKVLAVSSPTADTPGVDDWAKKLLVPGAPLPRKNLSDTQQEGKNVLSSSRHSIKCSSSKTSTFMRNTMQNTFSKTHACEKEGTKTDCSLALSIDFNSHKAGFVESPLFETIEGAGTHLHTSLLTENTAALGSFISNGVQGTGNIACQLQVKPSKSVNLTLDGTCCKENQSETGTSWNPVFSGENAEQFTTDRKGTDLLETIVPPCEVVYIRSGSMSSSTRLVDLSDNSCTDMADFEDLVFNEKERNAKDNEEEKYESAADQKTLSKETSHSVHNSLLQDGFEDISLDDTELLESQENADGKGLPTEPVKADAETKETVFRIQEESSKKRRYTPNFIFNVADHLNQMVKSRLNSIKERSKSGFLTKESSEQPCDKLDIGGSALSKADKAVLSERSSEEEERKAGIQCTNSSRNEMHILSTNSQNMDKTKEKSRETYGHRQRRVGVLVAKFEQEVTEAGSFNADLVHSPTSPFSTSAVTSNITAPLSASSENSVIETMVPQHVAPCKWDQTADKSTHEGQSHAFNSLQDDDSQILQNMEMNGFNREQIHEPFITGPQDCDTKFHATSTPRVPQTGQKHQQSAFSDLSMSAIPRIIPPWKKSQETVWTKHETSNASHIATNFWKRNQTNSKSSFNSSNSENAGKKSKKSLTFCPDWTPHQEDTVERNQNGQPARKVSVVNKSERKLTPYCPGIQGLLTPTVAHSSLQLLAPLTGKSAVIRPLYIVHPITGMVDILRELAEGLEGVCYGIKRTQHTPDISVEALAWFYCQAIMQQDSFGSYNLAGYSYGGLVAFEMARQFQREGKKVNNLVMLDGSPHYVKTQTSFPLHHLPPDISPQRATAVVEAQFLLYFMAMYGPVQQRSLVQTMLEEQETQEERVAAAIGITMGTMQVSSSVARGRWLGLKSKLEKAKHRPRSKVSISHVADDIICLKRQQKAIQFLKAANIADKYDVMEGELFQGDIHLIRIKTTPGYSSMLTADYGLGQLCTGNVWTYYVDGEHESMMETPHVLAVIRLLNNVLRK